MPERKSEPPSSGGGRSKGPSDSGRSPRRLKPEQYELKIRWERARQVVEVSATGVEFDFDSPLKVGMKYPVSLTAPGISISTTLEVTHCRLTPDPAAGRFFRVGGKFFPYVE